MHDHFTETNLSQAIEKVLETMFFSTPLGPAQPERSTAVIEAQLSFHGERSGTFSTRLSNSAAHALAADFLGEDEQTLTDSASAQVVCELANMICGTFLSQLLTKTPFQLGSPHLIAAIELEAAEELLHPALQTTVELESGILTVSLQLEPFA